MQNLHLLFFIEFFLPGLSFQEHSFRQHEVYTTNDNGHIIQHHTYSSNENGPQFIQRIGSNPFTNNGLQFIRGIGANPFTNNGGQDDFRNPFNIELFNKITDVTHDFKNPLNNNFYRNINEQSFNRVPNTYPCKTSLTTANKKNTCQGQLIFSQYFNRFDENMWQRVVQIAERPDYQFVVYLNDTNIFDDGHMLIKPRLLSPKDDEFILSGKLDLSSCTGIPGSQECIKKAETWSILPPVQSAKVNTRLSFSFKYGILEINAKLPVGDWIFPEIFLEPKENYYGQDNYTSELIKIALAIGNENLRTKDGQQIGNSKLYCGCKFEMNGILHNEMKVKQNDAGWGSEFHTYRLKWTPDYLEFSVDDSIIGRIVPNAGIPTENKVTPFDREFYISLGVGVGGIEVFPDGSVSGNHLKPWINQETKMMLNFWQDLKNWYPTWDSNESALVIESINIWAL